MRIGIFTTSIFLISSGLEALLREHPVGDVFDDRRIGNGNLHILQVIDRLEAGAGRGEDGEDPFGRFFTQTDGGDLQPSLALVEEDGPDRIIDGPVDGLRGQGAVPLEGAVKRDQFNLQIFPAIHFFLLGNIKGHGVLDRQQPDLQGFRRQGRDGGQHGERKKQ